MPPRYVYWTILIDGKPTSFRARDKDELLPTVGQLRRTSKLVELKYFSHGRLWDSPEQSREQSRQPASIEKRGRDWRPGGSHEDPRARFDRKKQDKRPWTPKPPAEPTGTSKPTGDRRPWQEKPTESGKTGLGGKQSWTPKPAGDRRPWTPRPDGDRRPWQGKPPGTNTAEGTGWAGKSGRPKGKGGWAAKPGQEKRPWSPKPPGERRPWTPKPDGDRRPWQAKPPGAPGAKSGGTGWSRRPPASAKGGWAGKPAPEKRPWTPKPPGERRPWTPKPDARRPWQNEQRARPFQGKKVGSRSRTPPETTQPPGESGKKPRIPEDD